MAVKKKLLVITSRFPYPVVGGDKLRIYEICKFLSEFYEITLICICKSKAELNYDISSDRVFARVERFYLPAYISYINCIISIFNSNPLQISYYYSAKLKKIVNEIAKKNDIMLCHLVRTAEYVKDLKIPKILEMTDAISLNYSRAANYATIFNIRNLIYKFEYNRIEKYEKEIVHYFDETVLVSNYDSEYLTNNSNILTSVITNGVDVSKYKFIKRDNRNTDRRVIIFIGNMVSTQNLDAACYFVKEILPLLKEINPIFRVVGNISRENTSMLLSLNSCVEITGTVEDINESVNEGWIGVCPVRIGAGIQNKILEYMSLGLPVITTEVGYEGLSAKINFELLVSNSPEEFANSILELNRDEAKYQELAVNARRYVSQNHDWKKLLIPYQSKFEKISTQNINKENYENL